MATAYRITWLASHDHSYVHEEPIREMECEDDPLGPARGIVFGLLISLVLWAGLGAGLAWLL